MPTAAAQAVAPQIGGMFGGVLGQNGADPVDRGLAPGMGGGPGTADTWDCPAYGHKAIASRFCPDCGAKKPEAPAGWTCPGCGRANISSNFCPNCGAKRPAPDLGCTCPDCGRKREG